MTRVGLTVPLPAPGLSEHPGVFQLARDLRYDDLWSSETSRNDAFTPLVQAAGLEPTLRLGTAIVPAFTRGPAVLAQSFASLANLAPGRVVAGIGSSAPAIVEAWNGTEFTRPWHRVRDTVRFLREAFTGEKVTRDYETFTIRGFRLAEVPQVAPTVFIAALREQMLRLAGREADGAILNWLSADDVAKVVRCVHDEGPNREIVARLFVCPSEDTETVRAKAKRHIAAYLSVPAYAAFHKWLGRGRELEPMWQAWQAGDRRKALELIPDELVDELIVHGSGEACRKHIQRYLDAGVTTAVVDIMDWGIEPQAAVRALGDIHT